MKRVHKELPQCGELVFIDSTSNNIHEKIIPFLLAEKGVQKCVTRVQKSVTPVQKV